ncbi:hypothetical protein ALC62_13825 [Cyphomyrmex costatus]|uniref:Uncharacterized protein n=1 Tax=Cyphomyrmex costatus TaxID=456900 RepID=A0A195C3H0_9HYME|nr:hypothetical protein ALC62_13825 [Cyphomyrmex costatus]
MHILQTHTHLAPGIEANMVTQLAKYDNEYFLGKYPKGGDGSGGGSDDGGGVVACSSTRMKHATIGRHGREKGSTRLRACTTICKVGFNGSPLPPIYPEGREQRDWRENRKSRQDGRFIHVVVISSDFPPVLFVRHRAGNEHGGAAVAERGVQAHLLWWIKIGVYTKRLVKGHQLVPHKTYTKHGRPPAYLAYVACLYSDKVKVQRRYRVAVSYSHDGKGVVGGLALGGRMAERRRDAKRSGGWEWVRAGDWGWMRKGGWTLGVSRGGGGGGDGGSSGSGGGGGSGGPTEGGEDRDTKGFDVQPFHRLYFSAPFYPFAARALTRLLTTPRITPYTLLILQRAPKAAID